MFANYSALIVVAVASYLIGSIPFAVVVSRLMGLRDPREYGSRNPGATNVLRSGNKMAAVLTLLGDAAKGWVAVTLAAWAAVRWSLPSAVVPVAALTVFLGHVFPLFLRGRGGKGVATALGVLLAISPWLGLAVAGTWLLFAWISRYSSLAALVAAVAAPLYYLLAGGALWRYQGGTMLALLLIAAVLLYRHRGNIDRLMRGKEPRIGGKEAGGTTRPR